MLGVIVNTLTVILGSLIGLVLKRGIPERFSDAVMKGIGICTLYIGISGALEGENVLIAIASIVIGAIIGTLIDIDKAIANVGEKLERKFKRTDGKTSIAQGFVTGSLLFCVGAMTIVGSLNSGISGDHEMIFTKSLLDFISSMMLSVSSSGVRVATTSASAIDVSMSSSSSIGQNMRSLRVRRASACWFLALIS